MGFPRMFHGSPVGTCPLSVVGLLGLENQTEIEEDMVLRVISYDEASYRDQMNRDEKGKPRERYPVVTLVL